MQFQYLLRDAKFDLHTDHANLVFIRDSGSPKVIRWKIDLQEYDFDLKHIAGPLNHVADYMSRNPTATVDDYVPETTSMCKYLAYMHIVEESEQIIEEVVMCNTVSVMPAEPIPEEYYRYCQEVHNEVEGHHGVENTLRKLKAKGKKWKYMRSHVKQFVKECDLCQKFDYNMIKANTKRYTVGGYRPFEQISMDDIGPFPADSNGNTYATIIIDDFSRWAWVAPKKDTSAVESARAVICFMGMMAVTPLEIKHDGGSAMANNIVEQLIQLVGATRIQTTANSHQENSIVERSAKEIGGWIAKCVYERRKPKSEWSDVIPFAMRIHNSTTIATIGFSPNQIVFGETCLGEANIFRADTVSIDECLDEFIQRKLDIQKEVTLAAKQRQEIHHEEHTAGNEDIVETQYTIGSYVLAAWAPNRMGMRGRPSKLDSIYKGPYLVVSRDGNNYVLRDLVTNKELPPRSVHLLKPYRFDSTRIRPEDMALKDKSDFFIVDEIRAHKGNWNKVSEMSFLVKWTGYDEDENTWEPWANVRDTIAIQDYLTAFGKTKLIPKKFKNG